MRWSLVVALSRFGDFASLPLLPLAAGASNPALATFSFSGATFSSEYVDFVGVELKDESGKPLQSLGSQGQQLLTTYDAPPYVAAGVAGFIPWLDVANKYAMQGSGYSPAIIGNLDWGHIATRLGDATDPVTKAIVGAANYITAAICTVTSMHPASVCQGAPIGALIAHLSAAAGNGGQP